MSPLPYEFVGLWERVSIVVDGRLIRDAGRTWWFQGEQQFLDVRAAGGGLLTEMFGGVTTWDDSAQTLSWSHDIDLHRGDRDDSGRVEWRDGDLIEHGSAMGPAGPIEYSEVWRRRETDASVMIADRVGGTGRLALCGQNGAVFIDDRPDGSTAGGLFTIRSWGWTFGVTIGLPLAGTPVPAPTRCGTTFHQFKNAWTVIEESRS